MSSAQMQEEVFTSHSEWIAGLRDQYAALGSGGEVQPSGFAGCLPPKSRPPTPLEQALPGIRASSSVVLSDPEEYRGVQRSSPEEQVVGLISSGGREAASGGGGWLQQP